MSDSVSHDVTSLLLAWRGGDRAALDQLMPLVYDELRRQADGHMRRERVDHTLDPTALVHEAYVRLIDQTRVAWQNRAHFFAVAATMMRRVVLNHARARRAVRRGGDAPRLSLDNVGESLALGDQRADELIAVDDALRDLATFDPRQARIVELRFFGGMTVGDTATALAISPATVKREWTVAKAWLARALGPSEPRGNE